ncbi:uncharacterized protein B0J16DRAFT_403789 [Fusarium flagelliforme]|uniref:uncharacterized protein n=1 Tax=Fusarium flagelliforme TaxID=2675880 RepID=UPI001E8EA2A0|nr:uncharacterized protein B0J16DRAFT_403789 [Fusarium flagelliforme]KAH7174212.1 hypothetical protein B0J16DRAFT_403789 [Fusarium flagelliforme]
MTIIETSNVERFSRLPTLILTNILGELQSDKDLFNLIRASPESLRIFLRYRHTVDSQRLARFLDLDIDGTMRQDALAIINFPRLEGTSLVPFPVISDWLDTLDARNFQYHQHTGILRRLFTRLVVFIEDYLAKTLDPFPARACMTLPTIGRLVPSMRFKGQETDIKPVSIGIMPAHTRHRLLQAFIRYELRCKIYDPRVWSQLHRTPYAYMIEQWNERLTLTDLEELHCVFEYVRGMYGAIFAQCNDDTWFPERPVPEVTTTMRRRNDEQPDLPSAKGFGLLFPDNLYFDIGEYTFFGYLRMPKLEILPCLGLDLLSPIIQTRRFDFAILSTIGRRAQYLDRVFHCKKWITKGRFNYDHRLYTSESKLDRWKQKMENPDVPGNITRMRITPLRDVKQRTKDFKLQILQSKIYRQRGWIFLNDSPTHHPILPSVSDLTEQDASVSDDICLGPQRKRRRSQRWHNYWSGLSLEDPLDTDSPANHSNLANHLLEPRVSSFSTVPRFLSGATAS